MKYIGYATHALALFIAAIFIDSLRYKFTDHEKTQVIFGRLNEWAASLGATGLFSHTGIFSQYVVGTAELIAAALLLAGILPRLRKFQMLGAGMALVIMTGALFFHVFTPLGIDPNMDGGGLFIAACLVWLSSLIIVLVRWRERAP